MRKRYIVLLIALTILIIFVGIGLSINILNFKKMIIHGVYNSTDIPQKEIYIPESEIEQNEEITAEKPTDNNEANENKPIEEIPENTKTPLSNDVIEELHSIIDEELYVLWNKNTINEITNHEKLQVALEKYASINGYRHYSYITSFSAKALEDAFKKTSIGYLPLNHENIKPFVKLSTTAGEAFIYDYNTKMYNAANFGSDTSDLEDAYDSLVEDVAGGYFSSALERFEELWQDGIPINQTYIETIEHNTWLRNDITPYEIYLKTLYEFFREEINSDKDELVKNMLPPGYMRLQYQIDAVVQAKKTLQAYNGVFIADVVGLGKTYICAMLAKNLAKGKKLIICPPVLVNYWEEVLLEFDIAAKVVSLGKLDRKLSIKEPVLSATSSFSNFATCAL